MAKSKINRKIVNILVFLLLFGIVGIESISAESSEVDTNYDKVTFLSSNPFFEYDNANDQLIGIYNGTTTEQFVDFYNMDVVVRFTKKGISYTGTILEGSAVSIEFGDYVYTTNIEELSEAPIQTYAYNGTNYSMPLYKTNLLNYVSCGWGCYPNHRGIDFAWTGINGVSIYAVERGTVYSVHNGCASVSGSTSSTCGSGWGNYVSISHPDGTRTLYAHMLRDSLRVSKNTTVGKSTVIGSVGSSGASSGYHLHFEVYKSGARVNPYNYLNGAPLPSKGQPPCQMVGNQWRCEIHTPYGYPDNQF